MDNRTGRHRYRLAKIFIEEARRDLLRFLELLADYPDSAVEQTNYELYRQVHTVKGSAATLGFNRTSRAAHLAEKRLEAYIMEGDKPVPPGLRERLEAWARLMGRMIDNYLTGDLDEDVLLVRLEELLSESDDD